VSASFARLKPPGAVIEVARTLVDAGFETWCVGGAVRDALLGELHLDWDLATAATPPQVRKLFRRTIPVGIEFGTVGVLDRDGRMHEVTTFRRDVRTDGRHAEVEFGASLDEDLARRDLTINAIAYDPLGKRLHDPFGGQQDLERQLVRAVGNAADRMREDRLRALRAIRFAARFEFEIHPETWAAIEASAPHLGRLSAERVKQEIEKTMEQVAWPSTAFRRWRDSGAFASLIPVLAVVGDAALQAADYVARPALRNRPDRRSLRIAALLSGLDYRTTEQTVRALRFSNHDIAWISGLVDRWQRLGGAIEVALRTSTASDAVLRRWTATIGRLRVAPFMRLAAAIWEARRAHGDDVPSRHEIRVLYRRLLTIAFRDPVEIGDLAIDGDDLRKAGVAPGPHLGRILAALLDRVLDDPRRNQPATLLEDALVMWNDRGGT
jgi:tRNA nucleotidyltransferase (CCA-adding enzyme)